MTAQQNMANVFAKMSLTEIYENVINYRTPWVNNIIDDDLKHWCHLVAPSLAFVLKYCNQQIIAGGSIDQLYRLGIINDFDIFFDDYLLMETLVHNTFSHDEKLSDKKFEFDTIHFPDGYIKPTYSLKYVSERGSMYSVRIEGEFVGRNPVTDTVKLFESFNNKGAQVPSNFTQRGGTIPAIQLIYHPVFDSVPATTKKIDKISALFGEFDLNCSMRAMRINDPLFSKTGTGYYRSQTHNEPVGFYTVCQSFDYSSFGFGQISIYSDNKLPIMINSKASAFSALRTAKRIPKYIERGYHLNENTMQYLIKEAAKQAAKVPLPADEVFDFWKNEYLGEKYIGKVKPEIKEQATNPALRKIWSPFLN